MISQGGREDGERVEKRTTVGAELRRLRFALFLAILAGLARENGYIR
jgi:hypothetical protein